MDNYDFSRQSHYTTSVFIIKKGQILFLKQDRSQYWLLPSGHINDNELPHEAAIREVLEETGLKIELLEKPDEKSKTKIVIPLPLPHHMQVLPCRDKRDIDMVFTAKVLGGNLKINNESYKAKWLSREEILNDNGIGPNTKYHALNILQKNHFISYTP